MDANALIDSLYESAAALNVSQAVSTSGALEGVGPDGDDDADEPFLSAAADGDGPLGLPALPLLEDPVPAVGGAGSLDIYPIVFYYNCYC